MFCKDSLVCAFLLATMSSTIGNTPITTNKVSPVYNPNNGRINDPLVLQKAINSSSLPFTFIVGADPQFGLIDRYILKKPDVKWDKEIALFEKCIQKINNLSEKPKFFAVVGDMVDSPPTDEEAYEVRKRQEKDFFRVVDALDQGIYFLAVSGNHDVGDIPTSQSLERYHQSFGPDYYNFVIGGVHFIVINSQYYVNDSQTQNQAKEQEIWIDEKLNEARNSPVGPVIFMHTPPFVSDPDETDTYFSLIKTQREKLLNKFVDAGVKYVFCGHLHKMGGGKYKTLEVLTTTAIGGQLGTDKSGFRVVTVHNDRLEHSFHLIED